MRGAITAQAIRTSLGRSVSGVVGALLGGRCAATQDADLAELEGACRVRAPILEQPLPTPHERFLRRMALFGVEVGHEAFEGSGVQGGDRLGLFVGAGRLRASWDELMPCLEHQTMDGRSSWDRGLKHLHPTWMLQYLSNNAHGLLAADIRALGEGVVFGGGNAGVQALCSALCALESDAIDAALVVTYDSALELETLVELGSRGAATHRRLSELVPPYAPQADGLVPGEAAAAIVIQRVSDAGDRTMAFIEAADGADGQPGPPRIATVKHVVRRVASRDRVVDGASCGHPESDLEERETLSEVFGPEARLISISSAVGELGASKALVQAILLTEFLRCGQLPPMVGLQRAVPGPLTPSAVATATNASSAVGVTACAPGLAGAIRVSLP